MRFDDFSQEIRNIVSEAVRSGSGHVLDIPDPVRPPDSIDAEYSMPCFSFSPVLRQSPAEIASMIASHIRTTSWSGQVTAEGPYVNFKLRNSDLFASVISEILKKKERFGHRSANSPERILIEYSSPNTNKPLHLGHVRNNVLGMAIVNLLRATGHECIPASILNDRGIHICKAMVAYRRFAEGKTPDEAGLKGDQYIGQMYVLFEQAVRKDPDLLDEARQMLRDWESGDPETLELWQKLNHWVKQGFDETYKRLGSRFELVQQESDTYLLGKDIVAEGLKKGVFYRKEDNSVWIDLADSGLDEKTVLRHDGTSLYITQDLGVAVERFTKLDIDRAIYIVGSEQIYHFKALFQIMKKLGYSWASRCEHLSYGMVYLPEGKMKSREGNVVDADNLIDKMQAMSRQIMESSHFHIAESRQESIAEAIGIAAVKYYILKFNPQKDIHFDPEKSMSFDGATGAYIQYCHARIQSVLKKANWNESDVIDPGILQNKEEIAVIRSLLVYPETVLKSAEELNPSRLATHLWEISKLFNAFYTQHRILDCETCELSRARLALSASVAWCLRSGLVLLGIEPVEEM